MTRPHSQQFHCPNCRTWVTAETMFGRWIRNHPELDSRAGYCVTDQDYWIEKWKVDGDRTFQLILGVEIKTFGTPLSDAQRNLLYLLNQIMRNRRQTPTKELVHQAGTAPLKARSVMGGKISAVNVRCFGIHVLTFSHLGPDDSEWMTWNRQNIDEATLVALLQFKLDPDTLQPLNLRRHHIVPEQRLLKQIESEA